MGERRFNEGDRVRVNEASPWLERVGAVGTVVVPPPPRDEEGYTYVLLDDDPAQFASDFMIERRGWSDAWPDDALDLVTE